jgi:hypothetical protein
MKYLKGVVLTLGLALAFLVGLASQTSCAPIAPATASAPRDGTTVTRDSRVLLTITNNLMEPRRVYVLRNGYAPYFAGVVPPLVARTFDITDPAPVHASIRVETDGTTGASASDEFSVLRPGTINMSIDPHRGLDYWTSL